MAKFTKGNPRWETKLISVCELMASIREKEQSRVVQINQERTGLGSIEKSKKKLAGDVITYVSEQ